MSRLCEGRVAIVTGAGRGVGREHALLLAAHGENVLRGDTWELPLRCRAYENGVFVVAVNRAGNENGRRHIGKSMIVDPVGAAVMAVACVDEPQLLVQELDLDAVATAQKSLPWWRDRRPDLYKHLV